MEDRTGCVPKEILAEEGSMKRLEQLNGAIARGWCHSENSSKVMDPDLASAIYDEIVSLLRTDKHPKLGCATTRQLIEEVVCRMDIDLDYRTK